MKTVRIWSLLVLIATLGSACSLVEQPPPPPQKVPQPRPGSGPKLPQPRPPSSQPQPVPPPAQEPEQRQRPVVKDHQLGMASQSLVTQARTQAAKGDFQMAAASVERALRIEPENPLLWLELGKIRQAAGNYPQAEQMARKALSLSGGDLKAQSAAWQLIAKSLRARGKVDEAVEADARANALTPDY